MKVKNFFAMMFAATAFIACNNEEIPNGGIDGENGEATWAAFSIQLPKTTGTRAVTEVATAEETVVKNVALYIEQGGHILTSGIKALSDFSDDPANSNAYKAKFAIKANTGPAKVWVVVNPTVTMHERILGLPANVAFHTGFKATVADMAGGYSYVTEEGITNAGFVMANHETKGVTLVEVATEKEAVDGSDAKNHFTIKVERAVAKVAVISKEADLNDLNALPEQGDFSDMTYYVAQVNDTTFMARKTDAGVQGGAGIVTPGNDFQQDGTADKLNPYFGTPVLKDKKLPINSFGTDAKALNSIYILENSMLKPWEQNVTHAVIVATWTPKTLYKANGTEAFTGYTTGNDFWFYNSKYYGEVPAELVADSGSPDAGKGNEFKWTGGKCYYRVYLYEKYSEVKFYEAVRNTVYNINISSIKAPGTNNPEPPLNPEPDPDKPTPTPIEEDVWVTANVDILPWSSANMDDVDLN